MIKQPSQSLLSITASNLAALFEKYNLAVSLFLNPHIISVLLSLSVNSIIHRLSASELVSGTKSFISLFNRFIFTHLGQVVEGNSDFLVSKPCNVDFTRDNNGITGKVGGGHLDLLCKTTKFNSSGLTGRDR